MRTITAAQPPISPLPFAFDEDGFLIDSAVWNENLAQTIAQMDGIGPITPQQFAIIHYLRLHYLQYGSLPVMAHVCKVNHLHRQAVREWFGSCREIWRIAGLPNPGEEAKAYMV